MKKDIKMAERAEIIDRIAAAKERLGKDLFILAHFYQHDDIIRFADFVGDSLQLAQVASRQGDARYIVFCSVSFMAETARILASPDREVLHPEPDARCPLADKAEIKTVEAAWSALRGANREIVPVVYVNSNADLKAFCGRNGGFVCTSSNAGRIFEHILGRGASIFFFPDENLGRNMARRLGIHDDEMATWDPDREGGIQGGSAENARVLLWKGFCYVHTEFLPSHIMAVRREYEGIKVIVHPECTAQVVFLSDFAGSTSFIKSTVEESPPGTKWAIGTEINFVERIDRENPHKIIVPLRGSRCGEMARVTPSKLLELLEGLAAGQCPGRVVVEGDTAKDAKIALERMLEVS